MKLARIALATAALLAVCVVGCKQDDSTNSSDTANLGTNESQLIEDDTEAAGTDDDAESGIDDPLSGSTPDDPGNPADGTDDDSVLGKIKDNPGKFFSPAGCLTSERDGNKLRHIFNHCNGPFDLKDFNGTITTEVVREPGKLTITHTADGFTENGADITGSRVIVYTRENGVITKTRTGNWTGKTAKGKDISHTANFVTTYDTNTKCITRDGSAQSSIASRSFERTVDGFKRCGIGRGGCPDSGKITLARTNKADDTTTLSIEFLGGVHYEVTRPSGKVVDRVLICNPRAS